MSSKAAKWLLSPIAVLGIGGALLLGAPSIDLALSVGDCKSAQTLRDSALQRGDKLEASYRQQEINVCEGKPAEGDPSQSPTASPSASPSASRAQATTSVEEFLANRPAKTKTSVNAYGPKAAVLPSLNNKDMEKLTASEAKAELVYVVGTVDRMQTADKALDLGIIPLNGKKNQVNDLTDRFVTDKAYWDEIKAATVAKINTLTPSVMTEKAGTVVGMSYSVPGSIPQIGTAKVSFDYDTRWLVLTDPATGKVVAKYRLHCHFQHGASWMPPMPKPTPGLTRTPEGQPEKPKPTPKPTPTPTAPTSTPPTCPPDMPHGTPPVCKDDPSNDPGSKGNIPTPVKGTAPAVTEPATSPSVSRPTGTYSAPASPEPSKVTRETKEPEKAQPTATGTAANG